MNQDENPDVFTLTEFELDVDDTVFLKFTHLLENAKEYCVLFFPDGKRKE